MTKLRDFLPGDCQAYANGNRSLAIPSRIAVRLTPSTVDIWATEITFLIMCTAPPLNLILIQVSGQKNLVNRTAEVLRQCHYFTNGHIGYILFPRIIRGNRYAKIGGNLRLCCPFPSPQLGNIKFVWHYYHLLIVTS